MVEFLKTLAIACIPAIITGIVTYIVARKNAASQISIIKEQNKHDLEKLMEQHKIDIDSLGKQHQQELEKMGSAHPVFIQELKKLTTNFQFEKILALVDVRIDAETIQDQ